MMDMTKMCCATLLIAHEVGFFTWMLKKSNLLLLIPPKSETMAVTPYSCN